MYTQYLLHVVIDPIYFDSQLFTVLSSIIMSEGRAKVRDQYLETTRINFLNISWKETSQTFIFTDLTPFFLQRERVAVAAYAPEETTTKEDEGVSGVGSGTAFGDIEFIKDALSKKTSDDDTLTKLHSLCFGKSGQKTVRHPSLSDYQYLNVVKRNFYISH